MSDGDDGLDAGAVLGHHMLDVELTEGVDHPCDARLVETAQVKAPHDRVHARDPGDAYGVPADADDPAMRARRDHHETAVAHVGHQRLLADERVLDQLAGALDAQVAGDRLPVFGAVHLAGEPHALGERGRLRHERDRHVVTLDLVAREAAAVDAALAALLPARLEVIDAAVEGQVAAKTPPPGVQEAGQPAPVIAVAVGEAERVDRGGVDGQLAEVVVQRVRRQTEVEGHREPVPAAGDLDQMRQAVLGAEVRHLAGHERAVPAGHRGVLAQVVDVVVDDGGDADTVDGAGHARILAGRRTAVTEKAACRFRRVIVVVLVE